MDDITAFINVMLGLGVDGDDLNALQMSLRAVLVFSIAIVLMRIGHKRFMGGNTTLDILLGIVIGSVMSRAITGNAPFVPTMVASTVLVLFHWLLAALTYHASGLAHFFKGSERSLIQDGELQHDAMRRAHITPYDLQEALRARGIEPDVEKIRTAYLERNGSISIITKE